MDVKPLSSKEQRRNVVPGFYWFRSGFLAPIKLDEGAMKILFPQFFLGGVASPASISRCLILKATSKPAKTSKNHGNVDKSSSNTFVCEKTTQKRYNKK